MNDTNTLHGEDDDLDPVEAHRRATRLRSLTLGVETVDADGTVRIDGDAGHPVAMIRTLRRKGLR